MMRTTATMIRMNTPAPTVDPTIRPVLSSENQSTDRCLCTGGHQERTLIYLSSLLLLKYHSRRIMFSKTSAGNGMTVCTFENLSWLYKQGNKNVHSYLFVY